jgi:predicted Fe-Mo cluster-binding NifX family protein
MRIVVTAEGDDLNATVNPRFGRCPTYLFVETETMTFEAVPNPALSAPGGAGIQAAQFVVERGAKAVLTSNVGPNAMQVLQAAGIPVYLVDGGRVHEAVEAYKAGRLQVASEANVAAHAGMGQGRGRGRGRGQREPAAPATAREEEIAALKAVAADLRRQMAEVMERIEKLEKES